MKGWEKFFAENEAFKKSKLYPAIYKAVIHYLYENINNPRAAASKFLEEKFNIKGQNVRLIVQFARRKGHPIASSSKGYWIEKDYDKLSEYCETQIQWAISMLRTISRMKKILANKNQTSLPLRFPDMKMMEEIEAGEE